MKTGDYILTGLVLLSLSAPVLQAAGMTTESVITPDMTAIFSDDHRILNGQECSLAFGLTSTVMSDDQYQYGMTYTVVGLDDDTHYIPETYSFHAGPEINYYASPRISTYLNDTEIDQVHVTGSRCIVNGFFGLSCYLDSRVSLGLSGTVTLVDLLRSPYGPEYYPYTVRASVTYIFAVQGRDADSTR